MAMERYVTESGGRYIVEEVKKRATIDSPEFTGTPKAPTAAAGTNTEQLATTAFVKKAVDDAVSGIYTPLGTKEKAEDLPDNPNPGDIWTVIEETVVTDDGNGKNVVQGVAGTVSTYDDLLTLVPPAQNGQIYKVETGDDGTGTFGTAYPDNTFFAYDGATWTILSGATGYPNKTDYKYTEEDGWTPMESGVDLSNLVTKEELADANYIKHDELEPVALAEVMAWFAPAPTYTAVSETTGKNPKTEGWYEKDGEDYVLTNDEQPVNGKTYYVKA